MIPYAPQDYVVGYMRLDASDIILRPGAGTPVRTAFTHARALAALLDHDIVVEGNGVCIVVTPRMDEEQCRRDYERALERT